MKMPARLTNKLDLWSEHYMRTRAPDAVIGGPDEPYLLRWYLTPWRRWLRHRTMGKPREGLNRLQRAAAWVFQRLPAVYLHVFLRPDDDRALHDHPFAFATYILRRGYMEVTRETTGNAVSYTHRGHLYGRRAKYSHRVKLYLVPQGQLVQRIPIAINHQPARRGTAVHWYATPFQPAVTLFLTGFRTREWGFWCGDRWVHYKDFTDPASGGRTTGKGCDQ